MHEHLHYCQYMLKHTSEIDENIQGDPKVLQQDIWLPSHVNPLVFPFKK